MDKYIITGISGFVGYHFVSYLDSVVSEETEVLGLDVSEPIDFNTWKFKNLKVKFQKINLLDFHCLCALIENYSPTYILHLASLSSVGRSWEDPASCFSNNTGIFLNIVETIRKENLNTKLLCIGSSEEYGTIDSSCLPLKECMQINPCNPYAVTKVAQESMAKCYVDKFGLDIMLTRSFNHIGPRQKDVFVVSSFCKQIAKSFLKKEKKIVLSTGNLNVIRDFLDVRDVVAAYYMILKNGKSGELYNVCSSKGRSLNEIINRLSTISNIEIVTEINPSYIRPNDLPIVIGDNSKLVKDTGWKPVYDINNSLMDIFDYWVKELKK